MELKSHRGLILNFSLAIDWIVLQRFGYYSGLFFINLNCLFILYFCEHFVSDTRVH